MAQPSGCSESSQTDTASLHGAGTLQPTQTLLRKVGAVVVGTRSKSDSTRQLFIEPDEQSSYFPTWMTVITVVGACLMGSAPQAGLSSGYVLQISCNHKVCGYEMKNSGPPPDTHRFTMH